MSKPFPTLYRRLCYLIKRKKKKYCFRVTVRSLKEPGIHRAKVRRDGRLRCRKILVPLGIYRWTELPGVMFLFPRIVNIGPAPQVAYLYYHEIRDTMPYDRVTPGTFMVYAKPSYACMTLMTQYSKTQQVY